MKEQFGFFYWVCGSGAPTPGFFLFFATFLCRIIKKRSGTDPAGKVTERCVCRDVTNITDHFILASMPQNGYTKDEKIGAFSVPRSSRCAEESLRAATLLDSRSLFLPKLSVDIVA
jgi:hypothetical protein